MPRPRSLFVVLAIAGCARLVRQPAALDDDPPGARASAPALVPVTVASVPRDRILVTLQEELARASRALAARKPRPYHLGYRVESAKEDWIEAWDGALMGGTTHHHRTLAVDVRLGSPAFDSHHPQRKFHLPTRTVSLPLEDDEAALRAITRKQTEARYWAMARRLRRLEDERKGAEQPGQADFSPAEPAVSLTSTVNLELDRATWEQRLRALSARFRSGDDVSAVIGLTTAVRNHWMVDSAGAMVQGGRRSVRGYVRINIPRSNGARTYGSRTIELGDLDPRTWEARLGRETEGLLAEVRGRRQAERLTGPWSGPAVFAGPAAAGLFHVALGHLVESVRERPDPQMQSFQQRLGQRVLPRLVSVYDDPTAGRLGQVALWGAYPVDDEGVRAQRVDLIKDGVLLDLLRARTPGPGSAGSNGHGRRTGGELPVGRQSTLVVRPSNALGADELRSRLREEARRQGKAFGLLVHDLTVHYRPPRHHESRSLLLQPRLSKVYEDGRPDEPLDDVELVGDPLAILTSIRAAADDYGAWNELCWAESGELPTSAVSPSILAVKVELSPRNRSEAAPLPPPPPATPTPGRRVDDEAVHRAMVDELARSMKDLHGPAGAPFHILYEAIDTEQGSVEAAAGAVVETQTARFRGLRVEVRLGDRTFDSGNGWRASFWPGRVPADDDYSTVRRALWEATSRAYGDALRALQDKQQAFAGAGRSPDQAAIDFAAVEPVRAVSVAHGARAPMDLAALGRRAAQASAVFGEPALADALTRSVVHGEHTVLRRRLLTSDGAWTDERRSLARMLLVASADPDTTSGSVQDLVIDAVAPQELPGAEAVARLARQLGAAALAVEKAPRVSGGTRAMVLFEPQPAGALLETMIGSDLAGTPLPRLPPGRSESWLDPPSALAPKLGQAVAPPFLDLTDDPTLAAGPGQAALFGAYRADAEGVPAQRVSLIERGVMKSLLTSRIPHRAVPRSNGHARAGLAGARAGLGVLVVNGRGALDDRALRRRALAEARARGPDTPVYIVRRVTAGWWPLTEQQGLVAALTAPRDSIGYGYGSRSHRGLDPQLVLRLRDDGSEEPVQGVRFAPFLPRQLQDIVAVGDVPAVHNALPSDLPLPVGGRGASVITPALLLRNVELKP